MGLLCRIATLKGARRGELCGLTWSGWDDERGIFTVESTLLQLGGKRTAGTPKTRAGNRLLFLDKETAALVRRHREVQAMERAYLGDAWQGGDLVFTMPLTDRRRAPVPGRPWNPDYVTKRFKTLCAAASVPVIKFMEGGRHTGRSLMSDAEVRQDISMREVGHSDRAVHARYNHPLIEAHQEAAEKVADLVRKARSAS